MRTEKQTPGLDIPPRTRVRLTERLMGIRPRQSTVHAVEPGSEGICCGVNPHDQTGGTYLVAFDMDDDGEAVKCAAAPHEIEVVQ